MAQKSIREYDAKKMLHRHIGTISGGAIQYSGKTVLIDDVNLLKDAAEKEHWLKTERLVVKPDHLFGKRGKQGLLMIDCSLMQAEEWIKDMNREIEINNRRGVLTHFLIEPFCEHEREYYLAFTTERESDCIHFSISGGIDIEANWDKVHTIKISPNTHEKNVNVNSLISRISEKERPYFSKLIFSLYLFFRKLHFTYLEFNPFILKGSEFIPMDCVARLDDTAEYLCKEEWGNVEFPPAFGLSLSEDEEYIKEMDSRSGASLKLTVLNPAGRIWTMTAGGGASVIFADTIVDMGYGQELANYGEYSGNPSTEETAEYARTILKLMTEDSKRNKVLLIGGGIANFTDVSKTFDGIITALKEYADKIRKSGIKILVRRGGPNYIEGLEKLRVSGKAMELDMEVFGPDTHMTRIAAMAGDCLKGGDGEK